MQTFGAYLVALLAGSAELAAALPSRMDMVRPRGQTLSVPVSHVKRSVQKHPALALAKVYSKYGKDMPDHLTKIVTKYRAQKRSTSEGSVVNAPESDDTEYIAKISIGTPAQTLPMDFDTGSSDLWVFSGETESADVDGQTRYYPSKSSTASKLSGATWTISYGDGSSSSGDVYKDTVTIGNLTVSSQAVETATKVSSEFTSDTSMSGLVGLAFSSLNTVSPTAQKTFFDNAMPSLDSPLFTANLKHDADGSYNFGFIDSTAYTGTIHYVNLYNSSADYSGFWAFEATGYAIGNGTTSTTSASTSTGSGSGSGSGSGTTTGSGSATTGGSSSGYGGSSSGSYGSSGYGGASSGSYGSSGYGSGFGGSSGSDDGFSSDDTSSDSTESGWFSWFKRGIGMGSTKKIAVRSAPASRAPIPKTTTTHNTASKRSVSLTSTTITGIADTGTTLLMLPDEIVSAYYEQVDGAEDSTEEGGYVFSCTADLPDFTFAVGSGQITVPGDYINWAPVNEQNTTCYGGIQSDADIGMAIFGDIALKSAFVVFDGGNYQLGWASKTTT